MSIKRPSPAWTGPDAVHTVLPVAALPIPAQSRRGIIQPLRCRTTCALVLRQGIHRLVVPAGTGVEPGRRAVEPADHEQLGAAGGGGLAETGI